METTEPQKYLTGRLVCTVIIGGVETPVDLPVIIPTSEDISNEIRKLALTNGYSSVQKMLESTDIIPFALIKDGVKTKDAKKEAVKQDVAKQPAESAPAMMDPGKLVPSPKVEEVIVPPPPTPKEDGRQQILTILKKLEGVDKQPVAWAKINAAYQTKYGKRLGPQLKELFGYKSAFDVAEKCLANDVDVGYLGDGNFTIQRKRRGAVQSGGSGVPSTSAAAANDH